MSAQLDLYRHSPHAMAKAYREAADTVRHRDPYWTPDEAETRAKFYEQEAARLERVGA